MCERAEPLQQHGEPAVLQQVYSHVPQSHQPFLSVAKYPEHVYIVCILH
jgi:hypothetical protein